MRTPISEYARRVFDLYARAVRALSLGLLGVSGLGVLAMTVVVCIDVVGRRMGSPLRGAYDWVQILGAVTIACALPYTTAVKGHVAIEYFFLKLNRIGRVVVDTFARLISIALFGFFAYESFLYGQSLKANNRVSSTVQIPLFWVPWVIAFCCLVVALVIVHHLLRPGKEMIKP